MNISSSSTIIVSLKLNSPVIPLPSQYSKMCLIFRLDLGEADPEAKDQPLNSLQQISWGEIHIINSATLAKVQSLRCLKSPSTLLMTNTSKTITRLRDRVEARAARRIVTTDMKRSIESLDLTAVRLEGGTKGIRGHTQRREEGDLNLTAREEVMPPILG